MVLLSKFQNNIKINENKIVAYCKHKIGSTDGPGFFTTYSAIIGQNAQVLKPESFFEINAGVGAYSKAALPTIYINGSKKELNESGVAIAKMKTPIKPGNYKVPVLITFIDENGLKREVKQTIEYAVSNCGN